MVKYVHHTIFFTFGIYQSFGVESNSQLFVALIGIDMLDGVTDTLMVATLLDLYYGINTYVRICIHIIYLLPPCIHV